MSNPQRRVERLGQEQQEFATTILTQLTSAEMKQLEDRFNEKDIQLEDV